MSPYDMHARISRHARKTMLMSNNQGFGFNYLNALVQLAFRVSMSSYDMHARISRYARKTMRMNSSFACTMNSNQGFRDRDVTSQDSASAGSSVPVKVVAPNFLNSPKRRSRGAGGVFISCLKFGGGEFSLICSLCSVWEASAEC